MFSRFWFVTQIWEPCIIGLRSNDQNQRQSYQNLLAIEDMSPHAQQCNHPFSIILHYLLAVVLVEAIHYVQVANEDICIISEFLICVDFKHRAAYNLGCHSAFEVLTLVLRAIRQIEIARTGLLVAVFGGRVHG